jgi:hypothetical protein
MAKKISFKNDICGVRDKPAKIQPKPRDAEPTTITTTTTTYFA